MEKAWLYETFFFQVVIVTVKEKKDALKKIKRCNVGQNQFYALQELHYVNKGKVISNIYETFFFQVAIVTVKEKKDALKKLKRCNVGQNQFYALQELHYMNKGKVISSFRGILYGFYFLASFIFLLLVSIDTRSTLAKYWGLQPSQPQPSSPMSTGLYSI